MKTQLFGIVFPLWGLAFLLVFSLNPIKVCLLPAPGPPGERKSELTVPKEQPMPQRADGISPQPIGHPHTHFFLTQEEEAEGAAPARPQGW